ncbi:MAG: ATP-binding region, ATPase domain protein [Ramlibacter sp.]|jgi:two-component system NtrC family sensor kinase|uniref:cache domain-containing protein n=1 Tax=Ramlibacter sp. TaxID=1917967 RepID=UPI00260B4141|nr:cache domain-containing protein [Ramlibacter sp.]MDB5751274.1 ATP-binding region, ATPase domain protein [Ramlibacter sp.]
MTVDSQFPPSRLDPNWVASGLRTRVLLPLGLGMVLLAASLTAYLVASRMEASRQQIAATAHSANAILAEQTAHEVEAMRTIMGLLLHDTVLQAAFAARDRDALLAYAQPILEGMSARSQVSHLYFHLPDRTSLLRVHLPERHGDRIDRKSLQEAQRSGMPFWGYEQGMLGNFTLRVVYPWRSAGEVIGYLELGVEFDHLALGVKQALGADLFVVTGKAHFDEAAWAGGQANRRQPIAWNELPGDIVLSRTTAQLPAAARAYLSLPGRRQGTLDFEGREGERHVHVHVSPFELLGEYMGDLLVVDDVTDLVAGRRQGVATVVLLSLAVGGSLMLLFHSLLGRVQRDVTERTARLDEASLRLASEQHERHRAEQKLAAEQERNQLLEARGLMVEELAAANRTWRAALRENEEITARLRETQGQLVTAARGAGRAEIATNVLHNVGNVLNSVNVSASVIGGTLRKSRLPGLPRALALLQEHPDDLGDFLARDPKGKQVPGYLRAMAKALAGEQKVMGEELDRLVKSIDHIKDIVSTQQTHAGGNHVAEPVQPAELAEDALRMQGSALARHQVAVVRQFEPMPALPLDRSRVLQILVNLISNAKAAMSTAAATGRQLTLKIERPAADRLRFVVRDEGEGIAPENLARMFVPGFTTRSDGHGFGLASSALAASELGGALSGESAGVGHGATFTLELPIVPAPAG